MPVQRSLTCLIYGEAKVGKSTLASTAPGPKLMLDVEGGHRFLPILPVYWDPLRDPPPVPDGTWDTCVVLVNDYDTMLKAYQWLRSGQHYFKSLIIDSISELQVKLFDQIAGANQLKMQDWGEVLRRLGMLLRDLRDLTMHPTNPLEAIVLTAMASQDREGKYHPYLQGQLKIMAPYFYDILGAVVVETYPNTDPTQPPLRFRRMFVQSTPKYEAGERVQGRLGTVIEQDYLRIDTMLDMVFGPAQPAIQG